MSLNRTRTLGAVAGLVGGALLLAGCGQAAGTGPEGLSNAAVQQDGTGEGISASPCSAEDFNVDLIPQPNRPGVLLMAVTNQGDEPCALNGSPTVTGMNMANEPIDVPVEHVDHPGAAMDIRLEPGESAFAGTHLELGGKQDPDTYVATGFTVNLPDIGGTVQADISSEEEYLEFPVKSIQVGTLQPSAQGVTF